MLCATARAVELYHARNGRTPANLSLLRDAELGAGYPRVSDAWLRDAWGREFRVAGRNGATLIVSAGPDGRFDTRDDMVARVNSPAAR